MLQMFSALYADPDALKRALTAALGSLFTAGVALFGPAIGAKLGITITPEMALGGAAIVAGKLSVYIWQSGHTSAIENAAKVAADASVKVATVQQAAAVLSTPASP